MDGEHAEGGATADRAGRSAVDVDGTPRWIKVLGLAALVVVALFLVVQGLSGGDHGPGRHSPGGEHRPPPGVPQGSQP